MPRTPNPTIEEIVDGEPLVNGSLVDCIDELRAICDEYLPGVVTAKNTAMGWTGAQVVKAPSATTYALTDDKKFNINTLYIGFQVETDAFGVGVFKNEASLSFFWIDEVAESAQDIRIHIVRSECLRAVLKPFLSGCIRADGRMLWQQLQPQRYGVMNDWPNDSGTQTDFVMTLTPNMDGGD